MLALCPFCLHFSEFGYVTEFFYVSKKLRKSLGHRKMSVLVLQMLQIFSMSQTFSMFLDGHALYVWDFVFFVFYQNWTNAHSIFWLNCKSTFLFLVQRYCNGQKSLHTWRCRGLNPGPFTCKANALPLRYIPFLFTHARCFEYIKSFVNDNHLKSKYIMKRLRLKRWIVTTAEFSLFAE